MKNGFVYILASGYKGTLYIGVTSDLERRMLEHKQGAFDGFTKKYHVDCLVYFEQGESITVAIEREKTLKHWKRAWKIALIEKNNPMWRDLTVELFGK